MSEIFTHIYIYIYTEREKRERNRMGETHIEIEREKRHTCVKGGLDDSHYGGAQSSPHGSHGSRGVPGSQTRTVDNPATQLCRRRGEVI